MSCPPLASYNTVQHASIKSKNMQSKIAPSEPRTKHMGENIHSKNQTYFHFETGTINKYFSNFYGLSDKTRPEFLPGIGFVICLHPLRSSIRSSVRNLMSRVYRNCDRNWSQVSPSHSHQHSCPSHLGMLDLTRVFSFAQCGVWLVELSHDGEIKQSTRILLRAYWDAKPVFMDGCHYV